MANRKDITGQTFGYLTAIKYDHFDGKNSFWQFRCKCGKTVIRSLKKLYEAKTPSCGCYNEEIAAEAKRKREEKEKERKYIHAHAKCNRDLTGEKFGRLEVIKLLSEEPGKSSEYLCECDCGNIIIKSQSYLISGYNNLNCGCDRKNAAYKNHSRRRLLNIYRGMIYRCYNEKHSAYKYYGAKGVTVSRLWIGDNGFEKFYQWAIHNGYSDELTLDRINPNGNYTAKNCRWADSETQANNKTNNVHVECGGEVMTLAMFCKKNGIKYQKAFKILNEDCIFSGNYIAEKLESKN